MTLRVRWLGRVPYGEAHDLQRALVDHGHSQHLLLLEHPPVYTLGVRASLDNVLVDPAQVGAQLVTADRGGDVTYHGPGQLVGYPLLTLTGKGGRPTGLTDTVAYVRSVEQLLVDVLADLGLPGAGRLRDHPGVWVDPDGPQPRKIAAIGVRLARQSSPSGPTTRSMHGFALNVSTDLSMFGHIIPCGIPGRPVTSLAAEGVDVTMAEVVDAVAGRAAERWGHGVLERQDVAGERPPASAGLQLGSRKPEWLRARVDHGADVLALRRRMRDLGLVTVCEEAGCPNLSECWSDGTATFMILGERCTRACGFCLIDTRRPGPLDPDEPRRVAEAVAEMGLAHVVITMVARDDLPDGGAAAVADTIHAVRDANPAAAVEVLISDLKADPAALDTVIEAAPDVFNHNLETVARLQRLVRPSAGYARSLAVLARAKVAGLTTKSGVMVGLGESNAELVGALADLAAIGTDIVTIGQYLRPSAAHLPVTRWVDPATFGRLVAEGERLGIGHVEASPLTRSSYHARQAADRVQPVTLGRGSR